MPNITIAELSLDNWRAAADLDVEESQRDFVSPNLDSIALSRFLPDWIPAAVYNYDTMVGFVFYGERTPQCWRILRFMIDKRYQGKGYGKAAVREVIRNIKERAPDCRLIDLSYVPTNEVACKVYADVGFVETSEVHNGEVFAALNMSGDT